MKVNKRQIATMFRMNGKNYVTSLDSRSKNRFNRLIRYYGSDGELIEYVDGRLVSLDIDMVPTTLGTNTQFSFIDLNTILDEIEKIYRAKNTPAAERISERAFKLINTIRELNSGIGDDSQITDDDEDDDHGDVQEG